MYVCACVAMSVYSEHDTVHLCMCMCTHMQICVSAYAEDFFRFFVEIFFACVYHVYLYVCCSVLQCVAVCCSVCTRARVCECVQKMIVFLHVYVYVYARAGRCECVCRRTCRKVCVCMWTILEIPLMKWVAVCCSLCWSVLQCVAVCVGVCCSVLQFVLKCVGVCCSLC